MSENATVFGPSKLNIVTTPLYQRWIPGSLKWTTGDPVTPDVVEKARGDLAIRTIHAGAEKGARVIVVDGANNRPFRQAIERENIYIYEEKIRGMSAGRQQGFRIAASMQGVTALLWTEPEKVSLVEDCLDPLMNPIFTDEADMVIPLRDSESFATYPNFQADMELESNRLWNNLLLAEGILPPGHPGYDVWVGSRGWHRNITELFLRQYKTTDPNANFVRPGEYCNALFFPVIVALIEGKRVASIQVPFRYPQIQKDMEQDSPEFRAKRQYQQTSILETTKEYLALLRGEPSRLALVV